MAISKKRDLIIRVRRWAGTILSREADSAEMPDPGTDEEDEFMRAYLRTMADALCAGKDL